MSSSTNLLLPLYHIRKQTKYFGINEKNLIVLLLLSTVFSLYVILNNLPSNINITSSDSVGFFIPKISKSHRTIHKDIIPAPPDLDPTKPPQDKKELDRNAMRQEKVKNVSLYV